MRPTLIVGMSVSRIIGQASQDAVANVSVAAVFVTALTQSFSEQYTAFDLATQLFRRLEAVSASVTPNAGGDCS